MTLCASSDQVHDAPKKRFYTRQRPRNTFCDPKSHLLFCKIIKKTWISGRISLQKAKSFFFKKAFSNNTGSHHPKYCNKFLLKKRSTSSSSCCPSSPTTHSKKGLSASNQATRAASFQSTNPLPIVCHCDDRSNSSTVADLFQIFSSFIAPIFFEDTFSSFDCLQTFLVSVFWPLLTFVINRKNIPQTCVLHIVWPTFKEKVFNDFEINPTNQSTIELSEKFKVEEFEWIRMHTK